jgi:hypothetical protein
LPVQRARGREHPYRVADKFPWQARVADGNITVWAEDAFAVWTWIRLRWRVSHSVACIDPVGSRAKRIGLH